LQLATAHEGGEKTSVSNRKSFDEFSALRFHTEHWQVTWLIVGNPEIIRSWRKIIAITLGGRPANSQNAKSPCLRQNSLGCTFIRNFDWDFSRRRL
jgi:hypothetical protein